MAGLNSKDVDECVTAASRLHKESETGDVAKLVALLNDNSFFVREAAAWPLAELAGPAVLRELFVAYQRGFDEGHDNDGFSAALLEVPALHPATRSMLQTIIENSSEPMKGPCTVALGVLYLKMPNKRIKFARFAYPTYKGDAPLLAAQRGR